MPCVAIKTEQFITIDLQDNPVDRMLCLQVDEEKLRELIGKQYKLADERPTSAFTLAPNLDN